ncbi:MAG TPA: hypothetical protein ENN06_09450 [Desulfobacteraceae bacterium]|nr:hypothetical protein [Desulfobacteraceae bacterium]
MNQSFHEPIATTTAFLARLLLSAAVIVLATVHLSGCAAPKQQKAGPPQAWEIMTLTVAEQLGNPENLVFPQNGVNDVTHLGANRYQVTSYADYTNREGGRERTYFYGVVVFGNGSGTVETIKFSR